LLHINGATSPYKNALRAVTYKDRKWKNETAHQDISTPVRQILLFFACPEPVEGSGVEKFIRQRMVVITSSQTYYFNVFRSDILILYLLIPWYPEML
jgi:hypothetical protein